MHETEETAERGTSHGEKRMVADITGHFQETVNGYQDYLRISIPENRKVDEIRGIHGS